ncbi:hypothetical protein F53441_13292 [Fusarium austroafricanum]|uniref:NACHT domain-containing protein n=1 Tax=Fusarium austroafricanum TaxID=2364996 RepID=A0A8H4JQQ2_9HYPO|nr:hypothetical protein F53441_13292 [Fusarium austroafricanum]
MELEKTKLDSPLLYTVGWIAALPIELAAARALLDEEHTEPESFHPPQSDSNNYTWGRMGRHNIVIASLPAGAHGTTSAATTATELVQSLPQLRFGLLVGVGGGIARPNDGQDIRLGDVVVSQPDGTSGGVVQYDFGKAKPNGVWERTGSLDKPPSILLKALSALQADHEIHSSRIPELLKAMLEANPGMKRPKSNFTYQGSANDRLFDSSYNHVGGKTCDKCDSSYEVDRGQRDSTEPEIHYGIIASGNTLVRDAVTRDKLLDIAGHRCLCVEMEAAGLIDRFPCLVIRGICDYADSHKNDQWRRYAAATAAAFAVELLSYVPVRQLEESQRAIEILQSLEQKVDDLSNTIENLDHTLAHEQLLFVERALFNSDVEGLNHTCLPGTRVQLLEDINRWARDPKSKTIFWLGGMAGTGKSTVSRTVSQQQLESGCLGATFFFKRGETDRDNISKVIPTLARQLGLNLPGMAQLIQEPLKDCKSLVAKTLEEKFEILINRPLTKFAAALSTPTSLVIVIDALDECDGDAHVKQLLSLFSKMKVSSSFFIRVFITSRPELQVQLGFHDINGTYEDIQLHKISQHVVEQDISTFIRHEFNLIRHNFNKIFRQSQTLSVDWPGETKLQKLIFKTQPLFIAAATVCRFVNDISLGGADELLDRVLYSSSRGHMSRLDQIYSSVLEQQVTNRPESERRTIIESFRLIVGTIITLGSPLSIKSLASLLDTSLGMANLLLGFFICLFGSFLSIQISNTLQTSGLMKEPQITTWSFAVSSLCNLDCVKTYAGCRL